MKKKKEKKILITTGKKKTAIARAVFKEGSGNIRINRRSINTVEPRIIREWILEPLYLAKEVLGEDALQSIDININVHGGGFSGQAQACRTAIGKGLLAWFEDKSEELRKIFAEYDRSIYVDDRRMKEPKKDTRKGARADYQSSYR